MRTALYLLPAAACVALSLLSPAVAAPADEPPFEYVLEIDGKPVSVRAGQPFEAVVGGQRVTMKLSPKPYRVFERDGIRFSFPRNHNFAADLSDAAAPQWSLDGDNNVVMVTRFQKVEPSLLLTRMSSAMVGEYGAKNVKTEPVSLRLAGREVPGKRLNVSFANQKLIQEIYALSSGKWSWVLVVQDSLTEAGKITPETQQVKALLTDSFQFTD